MTPLRIEHVTTDSGTYTVHVDGDNPDKPFAVFLHGGPGLNGHAERSLFAGRFRAEANFLWFDMLGCGDFQPASEAVYTWDQQIRDVRQVIRHFTPEPVHLVGHCIGTEITHDLIRLDRTLARSAIWYTPARTLAGGLRRVLRACLQQGRLDPGDMTAGERDDIERFLSGPDSALGARDAAIVLRAAELSRGFFDVYWLDPAAMARWSAWFAERPLSVKAYLELTTALYERGPLPPPDYSDIPVHMLYSDSDPVTPWAENGQWLRNHVPRASATVIPGAGHWIHFEKPDECVRHTRELLASG